VNESGPRDVAGGIFGVAALTLGVLQLFWWPMLFAPLGVLCLVIAVLLSPKYRGLYEVAGVVIAVGFVVGGAIAVIRHNPLY
jgi:hypothetical protein